MSDLPPDGYKELLPPLLVAGGVLLVMLAPWLGTALVQHNENGNVGWSPDEASAMAINLRCLGFLAFLGGCTERILSAIRAAAAMPGKSAQSKQSADAENDSLMESNLTQ